MVGTHLLRKSLYVLTVTLGIVSWSCGGKDSCTKDNDCPSGQYCLNSKCQGSSSSCLGDQCSTTCSADNPCPDRYKCVNGQCTLPNEPDYCVIDTECHPDRYCHPDLHSCVDCYNNDHCPSADHVCLEDYTCGEFSGCEQDSDCTNDRYKYCNTENGQCQKCVRNEHCTSNLCDRDNGICKNVDPSDLCTDQICATRNQICDDQTLLCRDCENKEECGAGKDCIGGRCVTTQTSATECEDSEDCNGQACHLGECIPCTTSSQCDGDHQYCDTASGNCIDKECQSGDDCLAPEGCSKYREWECGPCIYAYECRSGEDCVSYECTSGSAIECEDNNDCDGGLVCLENSCEPCTNSNQCESWEVCALAQNPAVCINAPTQQQDHTLGEACTSNENCDHLLCITVSQQSFCSRPCIGSNKGHLNVAGHELADCPVGYQCNVFGADDIYDGMNACIPSDVLPTTTPGYPFIDQPGAYCAYNDNNCQTMCNETDNLCEKMCKDNKDCDSGFACRAAYNENNNPTGLHSCRPTVGESWLAAGESCHNNYQCRSGICSGFCTNSYGQVSSLCVNNNDCSADETCNGTCRDHCRSNDDCGTNQVCYPWPMAPVTSYNWNGDLWANVCIEKIYQDIPGTTCYATDGSDCLSYNCENNYCVNKDYGESCSRDENCKSEWCNLSRVCSTPCVIDADCAGNPAGEKCRPAYYSGGSQYYFTIGLCDSVSVVQ